MKILLGLGEVDYEIKPNDIIISCELDHGPRVCSALDYMKISDKFEKVCSDKGVNPKDPLTLILETPK